MTDFVQDVFDLLRPDEGSWSLIVKADDLLDCRHQRANTVKRAATDAFSCDLCKPTLHEVEPRRTGRREVKVKTRVLVQPSRHLRMLVGPIIVHDQMQLPVRGGFAIDLARQWEKLLLAVAGEGGDDALAI